MRLRIIALCVMLIGVGCAEVTPTAAPTAGIPTLPPDYGATITPTYILPLMIATQGAPAPTPLPVPPSLASVLPSASVGSLPDDWDSHRMVSFLQ
jgi:hypothetical protein